MAALKTQNFLRLGSGKRQVIWDELRDEPMLELKVKVSDFIPVPLIGRWSVSAHGIVVFLIGADPGPELEEATPK